MNLPPVPTPAPTPAPTVRVVTVYIRLNGLLYQGASTDAAIIDAIWKALRLPDYPKSGIRIQYNQVAIAFSDRRLKADNSTYRTLQAPQVATVGDLVIQVDLPIVDPITFEELTAQTSAESTFVMDFTTFLPWSSFPYGQLGE